MLSGVITSVRTAQRFLFQTRLPTLYQFLAHLTLLSQMYEPVRVEHTEELKRVVKKINRGGWCSLLLAWPCSSLTHFLSQ